MLGKSSKLQDLPSNSSSRVTLSTLLLHSTRGQLVTPPPWANVTIFDLASGWQLMECY
ncbi:hypothetical protein LYNGBM3L_06360 [Moorena producens 3L]|uniref:Uncharacterized protein n=1 Tax=Moorena producens 3L TaxID=489825 RepID=F4XJG1_9CYAN|nr:hypothetical protein LYNGBM3L_06360 [Moorena producens 3L]